MKATVVSLVTLSFAFDMFFPCSYGCVCGFSGASVISLYMLRLLVFVTVHSTDGINSCHRINDRRKQMMLVTRHQTRQ